MTNIQWEETNLKEYKYENYTVHECSIQINLPVRKSMCVYITAHYPDRSVVVPVIDAREESGTFYTRADEKVKKMYPGAVYAYRVATDEETEEMNNDFLNQVFTWTKEN